VADPAAVRAIAAAARRAGPAAGDVVVVAVDGRSGAGKSVLATAVAAELGCPVVRLDDVYPGWDGLADGVRIVVEEVLEPLSRAEPASHPTWDWAVGRWGRRVPVPAAPTIVLEGCGALAPAAAPYAAVAVWVEAPDDVRRTRALERDGDLFAPHWDRWARQEVALYGGESPAARADLVVRTGG
jgi:uridine kinase